jgi:diguanylate cyclase (GGDEF)-like protein
MKRRDRLATAAAGLGIFVVLVVIAGITAWSLISNRTALQRVERSFDISDAYRQADNAAVLSELYAQRLFGSKDTSARPRFTASLQAAFDAADRLNKIGYDEDREFLAGLQRDLAPAMGKTFQLLDGLSDDYIPDMLPQASAVLDSLYVQLSVPAEQRQQDALAELSRYRSGEQKRSLMTLGAFALGIPLLLGLRLAMVHYEREHALRTREMAELKEAALTDNLTGLGNHRAFQEELRRLASSASHAGAHISVAIMDVDDFKMVNDENGHAYGDRVLSEVAKLMSLTRLDDRGFRIGGDEFALIMPGLDIGGASERMQRLRTLAAKALSGVTISIGVSSGSGAAIDPEVLRENADVALYEAKRQGKDQVAVFRGDSYLRASVPAAKAKAFRDLLSDRSIDTAYQPIVSYETGKALAYEALARPRNEQFEGPAETFEIADRLGRTWELDQLCMSKAFEGYSHLPAGVNLFVNLDPRSLTHSQFDASVVAALARENGVPASKIVIELTERTAIPSEMLMKGLDHLRGHGFRVALDDVGSGNAGLELLRSARFDFVKIDRSVLLSALEHGPGRAVVFALVALGNEIGAQVIAEGVENAAMFRVVRSAISDRPQLSIMGLQGFFFGKPAVPAEAAAA